MAEYRSKSYGDGRMEMESYYGNYEGGERKVSVSNGNGNRYVYGGPEDLRCYSASYATSTTTQQQQPQPRQLKKGKSTNGSITSSSVWCFSDPELQRKKRVASYKAYSVEGKIKRSFSKSFRWLKDRYTQVIHG